MKKVIVSLFLIGFLVSGVFNVMNLISIQSNSYNMQRDMSARLVEYIDSSGDIHMKSGEVIESEDVKEYCAVKHGLGVRYKSDGSILFVEIGKSTIYTMFLSHTMYLLGFVVCVLLWNYKCDGYCGRLGVKDSLAVGEGAMFFVSLYAFMSYYAMLILANKILGV